MKKAISLCITAVLLAVLLIPVYSLAYPTTTKTESVIHMDGGYYITVELSEVTERATNTKSGNKAYVFRNSSGEEQWRATIYGTWTYNGTSATCTSSRCTTSVTNNSWYEVSKSAAKSDASATAEVTMGYKFLGITTKKESLSLRLTCDANGNLS